MTEIQLEKITKKYGSIETIHGIDLTVKDGEFVVLVGPSGCGKSTTLRMIAGLETITGGNLRIGGEIVNEHEPKERNIAMVFQNYAIYPHMSVRQNIGFGLYTAKLSKAEKEQRIEETAALLGLVELLDRKPSALSGGQRQRVAIGRAMVRNPVAFLFDEPLSNLDAQLRSQMRIEIKRLHQRLKSTIVYVTHDQVEAMTMADRIVVMRDGHILQSGSPTDLYENPADMFTARFIGNPSMNMVSARSSNNALIAKNANAVISAPAPDLAGERDISVGVRSHALTVGTPTGKTGLTITGEILVLEPLGSETLVHIDTADGVVIASAPAQHQLAAGQTVSATANVESLYFFDSDSQKALIRA
ncbi:ABC transporter ATP-binding protein [Thalassospira marina]|uniref:Sugar ABC transporter ATP-binding protein n=1 Tax=Thalassospira marina TaxID=2048283 RepID=A0ABN5FS92_9PROT|nr:sn-glycerol-3-phosphate ABC transporter ATP-binding protein UgpC [Thalassospira marina]AUG55384.1 sugar ABC transporter ATP-binding protein [Thalassospira marina]